MAHSFKTRVSLRTSASGASGQSYALRLTVVFHPDLERIGAWYELGAGAAINNLAFDHTITIGRTKPEFSDGKPLLEPHVSRYGLTITARGGGRIHEPFTLTLAAGEGSDCRLGMDEARECVADPVQLQTGVPIRLGHGVVLLLRLVGPIDPFDGADPVIEGFEGVSPETRLLRSLVQRVAATDLPVLILGESGVGKEVAAQAIHRLSSRRKLPLVAVNMTTIPETLAAAQLFGSAKGAFSGAENRRGFFAEADGSTLFLDEIGDTPVAVQVQLLRALETGEIQILGGKREQIDVRIIAATDASLSADDGFRQALYNRIAGYTLPITPLRQRLEDIGVQALAIMRSATTSHPLYPIAASVSEPAVAAHWARFFFDMLLHDWPGNSRELQYKVRRALTGDPEIAPARQRKFSSEIIAGAVADREPNEREVADIHRRNNFEVKATASELGWSRAVAYRRLEANPHCNLVSQLSDEQIRCALAEGGTTEVVASRLGVSVRALRPRLKSLQIT